MWAAAIPAMASVAGDVMSAVGGQASNAMNLKEFYANQAFQQKMLNQEEDYNTQMSNTAVQRRMADFRAAGLNPMLAVGPAGVASSPTMGALGGGMNPVQNPLQSMSNLGAQVASAQQLASQKASIDLMNANAQDTRASAATKLASLPYTADTAAQNLSNLRAQQDQLDASIKALISQYDINTENARQVAQNIDFKRDLNPILLNQQALDLQLARLGMPTVTNTSEFQQSRWGRILNAIGFGPSGGAGGAASAITSAARAAGEFVP